MYRNGEGLPKDADEGLKWFRIAAEQGDALGQFALGWTYVFGQMPHDYAEAVRWLRKAAERDDMLSQFTLGVMYPSGIGVPKDDVLAYMWMNLAAAHADTNLPEAVQGLFPSSPPPNFPAAGMRDELATKMTHDQIAEAQRLAREWKPRSEGSKSLFERLMDRARQYFDADGSPHP
jgi:TPR repeat protein